MANFTLEEWKKIRCCWGLRCGSDDDLAKRASARCKNGKTAPSVCVDFNNDEVGDELWGRREI